MKILHVVTAVHKAGGGTSEVVPRMCEALVAAGHEVRLVTGRTPELADAAIRAGRMGVDIRYCPLFGIRRLGFLCVTPDFKREIIEGMRWCDIVHIHGHWQDTNWITPKLACRFGKPYVMQPHGFLEPERLKKSALQKKIVGALIERPNLNRAAVVVATAESERLGIEKFGVKVPMKVVPIGLDTEKIDAAVRDENLLRRLGLDPKKKTLLYFSRLTPIKGLDLLAEAWAQLAPCRKTWQLCIAGPDDRGYAAVIKAEYARRITDGSVAFPGPVYGDEKYALLKSVDAFVLPTRSENWSIAVQEALAAGLPTVCTKGAPWSIIQKEQAGRWVDVSVDGVYAGLKEVMEASKQEFSEMSAAGRRLVAREFGWSRIARSLEDVYKQVLCDEEGLEVR